MVGLDFDSKKLIGFSKRAESIIGVMKWAQPVKLNEFYFVCLRSTWARELLSSSSLLKIAWFLQNTLLEKVIEPNSPELYIFFIVHNLRVFSFCVYRFLPQISSAIRPFLPPLSVLVTSLCVGAPLAINIDSVLSPFGISVVLLVIVFHLSAFILGYAFTGIAFRNSPDVKPLQRTLSYETGFTFLLSSNDLL